MPPATSKGKGKAIEQTPLLDGQGDPTGAALSEDESLQPATSSQPAATSLSSRRVWRSHLLTAALVLLTLSFAILLGIILLAKSYAAPALRNINNALSHSGGDGNEFWKEAVVLQGPDAVNVVSIDRRKDEFGAVQLEVNMSVTMRIAVDTDFIMGFRDESAEDDSWWTTKWKALGRWGVRQLGSTTAVVHDISIYPSSPSPPLLTLTPASPIIIPLHPGLSAHDHSSPPLSLTPVSVPLHIRPSQNSSLLLQFVEHSWAEGFVSVRLYVSSLLIYGGHEYHNPPKWWELGRWRNFLKAKKDEVMLDLKLPIPPLHIPSHPPSTPGSELPALSDLLTLEAFNISSSPSPATPPPPFPTSQSIDRHSDGIAAFHDQRLLNHQEGSLLSKDDVSPPSSHVVPNAWNIIISAYASLAHPFSNFAPKLEHGVHPFPFIVSLPISPSENTSATVSSAPSSEEHHPSDLIPVARVYASPTFNTTHIQIPLSGYVLPLSSSHSSRLPDAISSFVSSYLSYKPSSIAIHSPLYPSLVVRALFPPPSERLELLRDVSIENMSIHPGIGSGIGSIFTPNLDRDSVPEAPSIDSELTAFEILASATVHARVVLPPGMDIDISVGRVWVDCFVFDGEVPSEDNSSVLEHIHPPPTGTTGEDTSEMEGPPVPEPRPLPTPLPPRAFARLTPKNWLNASSTSVPPKGQGSHGAEHLREGKTGRNVYVSAEMVDVPLEVLPGRSGDLSKFVTKVLFSKEPVVAGIRGVAAVGVGVPGLTTPASSGPRVEGSELILTGLPFEGNVRVGGRQF